MRVKPTGSAARGTFRVSAELGARNKTINTSNESFYVSSELLSGCNRLRCKISREKLVEEA